MAAHVLNIPRPSPAAVSNGLSLTQNGYQSVGLFFWGPSCPPESCFSSLYARSCLCAYALCCSAAESEPRPAHPPQGPCQLHSGHSSMYLTARQVCAARPRPPAWLAWSCASTARRGWTENFVVPFGIADVRAVLAVAFLSSSSFFFFCLSGVRSCVRSPA